MFRFSLKNKQSGLFLILLVDLQYSADNNFYCLVLCHPFDMGRCLNSLVLCNEADNKCICHVEMFSLVGPIWSSVATWRSYLLLALYGLFDMGTMT